MQAMSAINRLLFALGWSSPPEQDSSWGEPPPQKPTDRRMSVREPARGILGYLGWWIGDEFYAVAGQFRDISSVGALIVTREEPPKKHVWIGLASPGETYWCPAKVARVRETSAGSIEIGLSVPFTL